MKDTFYCIAKFARRNNSGRMEKLPWVHFYQTNKQTNKKVSYVIPTMNCYPREGQLRNPDLTYDKLYHPKQYQYSQHPIFYSVLNLGTKNKSYPEDSIELESSHDIPSSR